MSALWSVAAHAQPAYPAKTMRIVVPLAPGGNVDIVARALAQTMPENIGQQIIIENRPGASSLVGTQYVAKIAARWLYAARGGEHVRDGAVAS